MNIAPEIIEWLLQGDRSIVYQTKRDLLNASPDELDLLRSRIELEGWGKQLLDRRGPDGHWGRGYYQPKWTSTHYSLLELKALGVTPSNRACRDTLKMILEKPLAPDGGINYAKTVPYSDVCLNGMVLNMACYFQMDQVLIDPFVDYLLRNTLPGGGWNCQHLQGDRHFSVHTTLSVIEGLTNYRQSGYKGREKEIAIAIAGGEEMLLTHRLYRSHRTGKPMDQKMTMLSYPSRWRYDILRALEYFRLTDRPFDPRMTDAIDILKRKRRKDGTWPLQAKHPGQVHFDMEMPGQPSRWNTLRALRVLNHFKAAE